MYAPVGDSLTCGCGSVVSGVFPAYVLAVGVLAVAWVPTARITVVAVTAATVSNFRRWRAEAGTKIPPGRN